MDRIAALDAIIAEFDLNTHPFYQAWRNGTLPKGDLVDYSGEYGQFVATIPIGWDTIGETAIAEEEREHEVLWSDFQEALGLQSVSNHSATKALVSSAQSLMSSSKGEAVGALYAFEAQQPVTTQTKLEGLQEHYHLGAKGEEYFRIHANDFVEPEILKKHAMELSTEEFGAALLACRQICEKMWTTLDAVYTAAPMTA